MPGSTTATTKNANTVSKWREMFVHLIPNARIGDEGHIATEDVHFISSACKSKLIEQLNIKKPKRSYSEVFVISLWHGTSFFHMSIENIPRLVPYLDFLLTNKHIKIHVMLAAEESRKWYTSSSLLRYFKMLGLEPSRMVSGTVGADLAYLPQGGGCGNMNQPQGQIFSLLARQYIQAQYSQEMDVAMNSVVLIERTGTRRLVQFA